MSCSPDGNGHNGSLIVGTTEYSSWLRREASWCADRYGNAVISGESGSGKGVLLDEIKRLLPKETPYKRLGAPQLANELRHSQLFGHEKGSFTSADRKYAGLAANLDQGILPVDDGEYLVRYPDLQFVFLDLAEGRPVYRHGCTEPLTLHVRIFLLLQHPLQELVARGEIRRDLAERLDQYSIVLRPLREHADDIPALAPHMLRLVAERERLPRLPLADEALALLMRHQWPGNVRQLGNVVGKGLQNASRAEDLVIEPRHLPPEFVAEAVSGDVRLSKARQPGRHLSEAMVRGTLLRAKGNVRQASKLLGCSEQNVWYWIRAKGIRRDGDRS